MENRLKTASSKKNADLSCDPRLKKRSCPPVSFTGGQDIGSFSGKCVFPADVSFIFVLIFLVRSLVVRRRQRVFSGEAAGTDRQVVDDLREAFETKVAE